MLELNKIQAKNINKIIIKFQNNLKIKLKDFILRYSFYYNY
jgi:hypothetical protein